MNQKQNKIWWILSILFFVLSGFCFLSLIINEFLFEDFVLSVILLMIGIISFPLLNKKLELKKSVKTFLIIFLFLLGIFLLILSSDNYKLKQDNEELDMEKTELSNQLNEIQYEIQSNIDLLEEYQTEITESQQWFKINSELNTKIKEKVKYYLSQCYEIKRDICSIKLGCLFLTNLEHLNLEYLLDDEIFQIQDKLQSLNDFWENKGGDCEDYSLFYKAEYNYILEKCFEETETIRLESYVPSEKKSDTVWLDFRKLWYLENTVEKEISSEYIYPNIICGNLYDLNTNEINGHCMIALTKNKIKDLIDLTELNLAPIIESQTGEFMGLINDISSEIYLLEENTEEYPESHIYEIITDEDLFLFMNSGYWKSYSIFKDELETAKQDLILLKG